MIFAKKERVAGREDLKNYGPFRGATYFCEVSPVDAPEQIATAVVSQTGYQDVRDDLDTETYAEYLYDFLNSVDQLECNLLLQAKANKVYIFHEELDILDGFDASRCSVEDLKQEIETFLSMGASERSMEKLCFLRRQYYGT